MLHDLTEPYCAIAKTKVTKATCERLQETVNRSKCHGCASPYRMCTKCNQPDHPAAFPEVPYCQGCLKEELATEARASVIQDGPLCTHCSERAIRVPGYNYCLRCAVDNLSPEARAKKRAENPKPSNESEPRMSRRMSFAEEEELYTRVKEFTLLQEGVHCGDLMEKVGLSSIVIARRLMQRMHKEGIVGPPRGRHRRTVLSNKSRTAANGAAPVATHALLRVQTQLIERPGSLPADQRSKDLLRFAVDRLRSDLEQLSNDLM